MTLMTLDKNSLVRAFCGCSKISSGVPCSAICPPSMKSTRVPTFRAKPISCVDDDHRDAVAGEVGDDLQHLPDHLGVERGGRLIEEQHIGLHRQRPHDGDTLLLPAGELGGIGVHLVLKPHAL